MMSTCTKHFSVSSILLSCTTVSTGWRRLTGRFKLQVIFRKRATNYRALLRKTTYEMRKSVTLRHLVEGLTSGNLYLHLFVPIGWLRLVGSLKLQVSIAKEPYKRDLYSPKRHIILRNLLIVATPYNHSESLHCVYSIHIWHIHIAHLIAHFIYCCIYYIAHLLCYIIHGMFIIPNGTFTYRTFIVLYSTFYLLLYIYNSNWHIYIQHIYCSIWQILLIIVYTLQHIHYSIQHMYYPI